MYMYKKIDFRAVTCLVLSFKHRLNRTMSVDECSAQLTVHACLVFAENRH